MRRKERRKEYATIMLQENSVFRTFSGPFRLPLWPVTSSILPSPQSWLAHVNLVPRVLSLLRESTLGAAGRERTLGRRLSPCLGLIWRALLFGQTQPLHWESFCARDRRANWTKQRCGALIDPTTKNIFKLKRNNKARLVGRLWWLNQTILWLPKEEARVSKFN